MGDYNVKCGLSGLPIQENEPTLLLFLREVNSFKLRDTYWSTRLDTGWKPLLFPIEGKYNNHGWINNIKQGIEVNLIQEYFQKDNICLLNQEGNESKLTFTSFDDLTDKIIEEKPVYKDEYFRYNTSYYKHTFTLISKKAYQTAINLVDKYRSVYLEMYENTLYRYLCPYERIWIARRCTNLFSEDEEIPSEELPKVYFERGGIPITSSEFTLEDKEYNVRRLTDRSDHFLRYFGEAIESHELPYIKSTEDYLIKETLINKMVDMILLKDFCNMIKHEWHHVRTLPKYDLPLENIMEPWLKFQYKEISNKLTKWKEEHNWEEYE